MPIFVAMTTLVAPASLTLVMCMAGASSAFAANYTPPVSCASRSASFKSLIRGSACRMEVTLSLDGISCARVSGGRTNVKGEGGNLGGVTGGILLAATR
jgi:hypothetical protein